ncbi:MAG: glucose 1-dehydrogenase [Verrucomicrobia subdivision 3 bacterium]|nr:glucose 1-dehydrogenase [Limisphaerales bacterium]
MKNGTMRAVGVFPRRREVGLLAHAAPRMQSPTDVRIRTLEVGICGTDREICSFAYGTPPTDSEYLILGHEALGEVVEVGPGVQGLKPGDLVVPSVRRPCPHHGCSPCRVDRQDFCFTGDFTERGIKMTHGFMTEYFVEEDKHLNTVPQELRDVAVLVEPLTVAEKALAQVWQVQNRLPWHARSAERGAGKTAVVLGAGPVGILGAMALLVNGFKTYVYSRSPEPNPKADLVNSIGAKYVSAQTVSVKEFAGIVGTVDLVYEAIGVASVGFEVLKILGLNGVFVFTGIPPHKPAIPIEADTLMRDMVLKNQVIVGTVNADRPAFEGAIRDLGIFKQRWPRALSAVISGRYPMEAHRELLLGKATGIKNVITIGQ